MVETILDIRFNIYLERMEKAGWRYSKISEVTMTFGDIVKVCTDWVKQGYYVLLVKTPYVSASSYKPVWAIFRKKRKDWKRPRLRIIDKLSYLDRYNDQVRSVR